MLSVGTDCKSVAFPLHFAHHIFRHFRYTVFLSNFVAFPLSTRLSALQVALEQEVNSRPSSGCMYTPVLPKSATVEFEGFCIVSVMKHRMMKPVMPEVGYIRYQGKIYGFADENAMRAFTETPQVWLGAVAGCAYQSD